MQSLQTRTTALFILTILALTPVSAAAAKTHKMANIVSMKQQGLRDKMRELWMDHAVWTHEYIAAAADDAPNKQIAAERLLRNQDDIGAAVAGYYGKEAGDKLAKLLREHIMIATEVVAAAKAGDDAKLSDADKRWHVNADEISAFLSGANPAWAKKEVTGMMYQHLALTTNETVARLKKNWSSEVSTYDNVRAQLLGMADMLSNGIVKQFPSKF